MLCVRRPLYWTAVFYAFGLLIAGFVPVHCCVFALCLTFAAALFCMIKEKDTGFLWIALAICCIGVLRMGIELGQTCPVPSEPMAITARVVDCANRNDEEGYAVLIVDRMRMADGQEIAPGRRVRLYVRMDAEQEITVGGMIRAQKARLSALRERRNPGGFDQEGYYRSRGIAMTASAGEEWMISPPHRPNLYSIMYALRSAVRERIDTLFTYAAPYFHGLLLGVKDGIDETVYADIRISGLAHLLAVSGLHVSALLGFVLFVLNKRQVSLRAGTLIALCAVWGFALIVGTSVSALRACLMGSTMIFARALHERYDAPCALAAAFLLLTIINPWHIRDTGFVLSFATVGGMLLVNPSLSVFLERKLKKLPRLASAISVSVSAQIACLPFQLMYFGEFSLIGLGMNLICVPLATVLVIGGLMLLLISVIFLPAAQCAAPVLRIGAAALQGIAQAASNIPFASLRVASPDTATIAAYYALLLGVSPLLRRKKRIACITLSAVVLAGCVALQAGEKPSASYVTLDVGQGDCAVLRSGEGAVCVIDAGPEGSSELTGYVHHKGLSIDLLILSHLDSDHAGGVEALAQARIPVRRIVMPYGAEETETSPEVLRSLGLLASRGSEIVGAQAGDTFSLPGIEIAVLGPENMAHGSNERSLVTRFEVEGVTILSMGDAPADAEPLRDAACDIVKIAHHGSKSSTSELFLDFARPETAIISVGNNAFGHPSPEVLTRLAQRGVRILRTDVSGAIEITLDNGTYQIKTMLHTGE